MPRGRRIGLLGGSFNPAHEGHLHISREALRRLGLDQVWWLVSPQNPLKSTADMAALADRVGRARALAAADTGIRVTDLEARLGTRYTADSVAAVVRRWPRHRFVWLMGADNLVQIARWERWSSIFHAVPVAVFDRPAYLFGAMAGLAAHRFGRRRVRPQHGIARRLVRRRPPAWTFFAIRRSGLSATAIRAGAAPRRRARG